MPRARNIKPSLFKNEDLGTADPILTILFASLWCLADRRGRLEDRPLRIKAETFPYREIAPDIFNGYLTELERLGFIHRFNVDGIAIIQVVNFEKHQSPHHTEKESELPCKPDDYRITVKEPLKNGEYPCQNALIPDSFLLIPDSETPLPLEKTKRGTRVNANFQVTDSMRQWATLKFPTYDVDAETEKFVNYWLGATGRGAVKMDWEATWRNWMINEKKPILKKTIDRQYFKIDIEKEEDEYDRRIASQSSSAGR